MNIDLSGEQHFSKKYFKLINECGNYILEYIDKIEHLHHDVDVFAVVNNKQLVKDIVNSFIADEDDGSHANQIIGIATVIKEIVKCGIIEIEYDKSKLRCKFNKREDVDSYYATLLVKESIKATKKMKK